MIELKEIEKIAREVLEKEPYLDKKENCFEYNIYAEYNDYLHEDTIKYILSKESSEERYDALYETLFEMYDNYTSDIMVDYRNKILSHIEEHHPSIDYYEAQDYLDDYLSNILEINLPTDHYLDIDVKANLVLDTGDANYDFSINELAAIKDSGLSEESSILWVSKTQGYNKEQTEKAILEDEYNNSKFLKSLSQEVLNAHYMNAFTFLINSTFRELMDFDKTKTKSITVSKNTNCGLVDFWYGAGGTLEVELEKDIEIPVSIIDSFTIDGGRGTYSVDNIYGLISEAWNGNIKYNSK